MNTNNSIPISVSIIKVENEILEEIKFDVNLNWTVDRVRKEILKHSSKVSLDQLDQYVLCFDEVILLLYIFYEMYFY